MLRFGDFVLDRDARQLFRGGIQVYLPPKALELLDPLVSARPVVIDAPGVSRRHACIRVAGWAATIEDLGSKNGMLVRDQAVSAPTPIADGAFRVGRVALVFRSEKDEGDTVTDNR